MEIKKPEIYNTNPELETKFLSSVDQSANLATDLPAPAAPASKKTYLLLALTGLIIAGIIAGSYVIFAAQSRQHALSNHPTSKASSQQHTASNPAASPNQNASPAISTPPAAPTATPKPAAPPAPVSLSDQDNSRTLTIPVGTILHINLSGAVGYHWSVEARTDYESIWSNDSITRGSDGSISDTFQAGAAGQDTVGYNDNPDCYPTCTSEPARAEWHVTITVQ